MRRRGFLLGAVAGVCVIGEGADGALRTTRPTSGAAATGARALPIALPGSEGKAIAPPGSEDGARLRTRCTGCNLCVAKCPTKVLKAATLEYGILGTMMPVMDFARGFCEKDCTVCGEVCPTGAIRRLTKEEKAQTKIGCAVLAEGWQTQCLAFKDGHPCALCEKHCAYQAVKVVEEQAKDGKTVRRPVVDAAKCIGCGACAHCCPAQVLAIQS